jgi:4-amino-4-deoxy-L-arabinose transferase-like glycosyltransferase
MGPSARSQRRAIRGKVYVYFLLSFALLLFLSHLPLLNLPYFWDEAAQYVPSALDLMHDGAWIPHSVPPLAHPPGVMAYLALWWRIAGYHPAVTRSAMLLLASFGMLAAFLLAIELLRESRGKPALLMAALLCVSPVFFAQSMLAQLDAPAMAFTALALLFFLQDRIPISVAACVALVMMKETGVLIPLVLGGWLAYERRWRDAALYAAPIVVLASWLVALKRASGYWLGSPGFTDYNLFYLLHPVRLAVSLARRLYYLFAANFHWVGAIAIVYAWRKSRLFLSRSWKVAWLLVAAHVALVTVLGGAVLERYLLPILPIVYTAMAAGIVLLPKLPRRILAVVLLCGVAAANFINPPYPFPYENNLAFTDFLKLQMDAADYVEHWYPEARICTASPMALELSHPDLGFVKRPMSVQPIRNFSAPVLAGVKWENVQVLIAFSRSWDPDFNFLRLEPVVRFWQRYYGPMPNAGMREVRERVPMPIEQHFARRGQWVDIYVNPSTPRTGPLREQRAQVSGPRP